jgi:hypothetical protein
MPFEVPTSTFNAQEHAANKVLRSNQLEETILQQFKSAYEDFWGVSDNAGSRHSVEEMQAILNVLGATAIAIMTAAGGLVQFIDLAYPDALESKYRAAAFDYTVGQSGITLTKLADAWAPPVVEEVGE